MKNKKQIKPTISMVIDKLNILALLLIVVIYTALLSLVIAIFASEKQYVFIPKYSHQLNSEVNVQTIIFDQVTGSSTVNTKPYIFTAIDTKTTNTEGNISSEVFTNVSYNLGILYNNEDNDDMIYSRFYSVGSSTSELPLEIQRMGIVRQGSTSRTYTGSVSEIQDGSIKTLYGYLAYQANEEVKTLTFKEEILSLERAARYQDTYDQTYLEYRFSLLEETDGVITYQVDVDIKDLTTKYHLDMQLYIGSEDSAYRLFGLYNYSDDDESFTTRDLISSTYNSFEKNSNFQFVYANIHYYSEDSNTRYEYFVKTDLQKLIAIL